MLPLNIKHERTPLPRLSSSICKGLSVCANECRELLAYRKIKKKRLRVQPNLEKGTS